MHATRFDAISRFLAQRRVARRRDRTSDSSETERGEKAAFLFVQSFQSGTVAPKDGEAGRYTVTLEHGLGQTIAFSDRPDRVVGAGPTPQFLEGLGFTPDNPPNAALVVETASGTTDIAVVELFDPLYDPTGPTVTYEVAVLQNWEDSADLGFTQAPVDLGTVTPAFGAAHLFIDDCGTWDLQCVTSDGFGSPVEVKGTIPSSSHDGWCFRLRAFQCLPCEPSTDIWGHQYDFWTERCNTQFPECNGNCHVSGL